MPVSVDEIITKLTLIDNYSYRAERIAGSTSALGRKIDQIAGSVAHLAELFGIGLVGGLIEFGIAAIKAAANFETLRITLDVLNNSAEEADRKLAFIRKLAIPALDTFEALARAGTELESFGLNLERVLPLAAKLSAAFQQNPAALEEAVRLFGRIASGGSPNIRELTALGLSRAELSKQGVKFNPMGHLESDAKTALEGIERLINSKYGNILDRMAGTTASKLDSVRDKWEEVLRKIGDALAKYANPALDKLIELLDKLEKSQSFQEFVNHVGKAVVKLILAISLTFSLILAAIGLVHLAVGNIGGAIIAGAEAAGVQIAGGVLAVNVAKLFKEFGKPGKPGAAGAGIPPTDKDFFKPGKDPTQDKIEENTSKIAINTEKALDLRRFALGGGAMGQLGITPVEFWGHGAGGGRATRPVRVEIPGSIDANLRKFVEDIVQGTVTGLRRQGEF